MTVGRIPPGGGGAAIAPSGAGGGLTIGGGGSSKVATDVLTGYAAVLDDIAFEFHTCGRSIARIDRGVTAGMLTAADAPLSAARAEAYLDDATRALDDSARWSGWISTALTASAVAYGEAERAASRLMQDLGAELGMALGLALPTIGAALLPYALGAAAVLGSGYLLASLLDPAGTRRATAQFGRMLDEHRGVLSDPALIQLVRVGVMSADDVVGGILHVPPSVMRTLGDEGLGITGVGTAAVLLGTVVGIGGALRETPVRVVEGRMMTAEPVSGLAARVDRIPSGSAQVRVDRYISPGRPDRFEVYLAGTRDFGAVPGDDPFDLTSDVTAMGPGDAGSTRAVEAALAEAGVTPESPVVLTGHSQGGLVAARLAASGDYNVQGLYTLGAPAAQVEVPDTVPWVAVEHTDDIVPALGGMWNDDDPVLVRREAFGTGASPPDPDRMFPAHDLSAYRETAELADVAVDPRLSGAVDRMDRGGAQATRVESRLYLAVREEGAAR